MIFQVLPSLSTNLQGWNWHPYPKLHPPQELIPNPQILLKLELAIVYPVQGFPGGEIKRTKIPEAPVSWMGAWSQASNVVCSHVWIGFGRVSLCLRLSAGLLQCKNTLFKMEAIQLSLLGTISRPSYCCSHMLCSDSDLVNTCTLHFPSATSDVSANVGLSLFVYSYTEVSILVCINSFLCLCLRVPGNRSL